MGIRQGNIDILRINKNIEDLRLQLDLLEEIVIGLDVKMDKITAHFSQKSEKDNTLELLDEVTFPHGRVPGDLLW